MSRITKQKKKRIKQGDKITRRKILRSVDDHIAMLAANVDYVGWAKMPEHIRQLYRFRAQQAMSIFTEQSDGQS